MPLTRIRHRHIVHRLPRLKVKSVAVGALDQELLDALRASVLFESFDSQVQGAESLRVLGVKVATPSDDVVQGELGS